MRAWTMRFHLRCSQVCGPSNGQPLMRVQFGARHALVVARRAAPERPGAAQPRRQLARRPGAASRCRRAGPRSAGVRSEPGRRCRFRAAAAGSRWSSAAARKRGRRGYRRHGDAPGSPVRWRRQPPGRSHVRRAGSAGPCPARRCVGVSPCVRRLHETRAHDRGRRRARLCHCTTNCKQVLQPLRDVRNAGAPAARTGRAGRPFSSAFAGRRPRSAGPAAAAWRGFRAAPARRVRRRRGAWRRPLGTAAARGAPGRAVRAPAAEGGRPPPPRPPRPAPSPITMRPSTIGSGRSSGRRLEAGDRLPAGSRA